MSKQYSFDDFESVYDYDDDREVGFKSRGSYGSSGKTNKRSFWNSGGGSSWGQYFSFSKQDQPKESCIKWGYSYKDYNLDKYIRMFGLKKAEIAKKIIEKYGMSFIFKDLYYFFYTEDREFIINTESEDWYDQICEFDNYLLRKFTKENQTFSYIIVAFLLEHVFSIMFNNFSDDNNNCPKDINETNKAMEGTKNLQDLINKAFQQAQSKNDSLEDVKKELGIGSEEENRDEDIFTFMENDIFLHLRDVKKFFKDMFSKKGVIQTEKFAKISTEDILDADDFTDFVDLESFATSFPNFEVFVKKGAKIKFDIYVDVSGSMRAKDIIIGNSFVERASMAKVLAVKMASFGILGDVYTFHTGVGPKHKHPRDIRFNGGGTYPDACIEHRKNLDSKKKAEKYLILTDGDRGNGIYDPNCIMLSIAQNSYVESNCRNILAGVKYNSLVGGSADVVKKYMKNKQYVFFNGKNIISFADQMKNDNKK